ncbi:MAG: flagellar hook-associated protein FlgL [Armatimonadetes bacterium]|nr:flagellar hook-associated protein FlgL [Armatimonadota bacterium]
MRISTAWRYVALAKSMTEQERRMYELQVQVSTGKRVNRPSDDPIATGSILGARALKMEIQQQERVVPYARMALRHTEQCIEEMYSGLQRVSELVTRAANATLSPEAREAIAIEIEDIERRMVSLANSQVQGKYLFGGRLDHQPPLVPTGDPARPYECVGDEEPLRFILGKDIVVEVSVTARGLMNFENAAGSRPIAGEDEDVISFLRDAETAVRRGDANELNGIAARLEKYLNHFLLMRARVGVEDKRLDRIEKMFQDEELRASELLSTLEDCDMAETLTRLRMAEVVYQATLGAAAKAAALPSLVEMGW